METDLTEFLKALKQKWDQFYSNVCNQQLFNWCLNTEKVIICFFVISSEFKCVG